jgi:hypothetical protein
VICPVRADPNFNWSKRPSGTAHGDGDSQPPTTGVAFRYMSPGAGCPLRSVGVGHCLR